MIRILRIKSKQAKESQEVAMLVTGLISVADYHISSLYLHCNFGLMKQMTF